MFLADDVTHVKYGRSMQNAKSMKVLFFVSLQLLKPFLRAFARSNFLSQLLLEFKEISDSSQNFYEMKQ